MYSKQFKFDAFIEKINGMDAFEIERAGKIVNKRICRFDSISFFLNFFFRLVCGLTEQNGVIAVFGTNRPYSSEVVASICNNLGLPHITAYWQKPENVGNPNHKFTRNFFPETHTLARALGDVIVNYGWTGFALIYDSVDSLTRLQYILQLRLKVSVYRLPIGSDFKPILKEISKSGESRIIIDCGIENTLEVLRVASEVNLKEEYVVGIFSH